MSAILNLSIDLSKLDKSKLVEGKYLNTQIFINDETRYGNNVSMAYSQSKEESENKVPKTYIANGRVVYIKDGIKLAEKQEKDIKQVVENNMQQQEDDSLPF